MERRASYAQHAKPLRTATKHIIRTKASCEEDMASHMTPQRTNTVGVLLRDTLEARAASTDTETERHDDNTPAVKAVMIKGAFRCSR